MKHVRSSSSAVAGATWWMLIKLLTSRAERIDRARSAINMADRGLQGRDNSLLRPEDGYLQLVYTKAVKLPSHCHAVAVISQQHCVM